MNNNYGKKILTNSALGILFKIMTLVLSLLSRYAFVFFLSDEHLGIQGLYTNLLSVLSMADFGINAVMIYMLYEPLATQDKKKLAALMRLFRRLYWAIAGVVLLVGALLIPLLPYVVTENLLSTEELIKYYLLFLANSAISYLGAYKSTLLIADQKGYFVNAILFASNTIRVVGQIAALYLTRDFIVFLFVMLFSTVLNNIILTWIANRQYPAIKEEKEKVDLSNTKKRLIEKTKAVFLYRIGGTLIDSTDNILISILVGTVTVGYYSNYSIITTNLFALVSVVSQAYMTGIGNRSVQADMAEKKEAFYAMMLVYFFLGTVVLCGILSVMNDFIIIWLQQEQYVLSQGFVAVIAIRLFLDIILSPNWAFREAQGLFNEAKTIRICTAALNLALSIVLGKLIGLIGIIGATAVSKVCTTLWFEPRVICKKVFNESTASYWKLWFKLIAATTCAVALSIGMTMWLDTCIQNSILKILAKGISSTIAVIGTYALLVFQEKQYSGLARSIKDKIKLLLR